MTTQFTAHATRLVEESREKSLIEQANIMRAGMSVVLEMAEDIKGAVEILTDRCEALSKETQEKIEEGETHG